MRGRRRRGGSLWLALMALGLAQCGEAPQGRVLLVGIDGASPRVVAPLMTEGRLPLLARMAQEGTWGPLRSVPPLASPPLWATIATGKTVEKHGIHGFARADDQGTLKLFLSTDRTTHALWDILSDRRVTVATVNWWNTYPPTQIPGVMVSDHVLDTAVVERQNLTRAVADTSAPVVYPPEWKDRVARILEERTLPVAFPNPFTEEATLPRWIDPRARASLARHFEEDGLVTRMALDIEAEVHPRVLMVFLPGIDRISHFLWGMLEPEELYPERLRPTPEERAGGRAALRAYYEYTDRLLGALLERYGPDDFVMVVSDHGFEAGVSLMSLTGQHASEKAQDGVVFARGAGVRRGGSLAPGQMRITDVTPTLLAWLGMPIAEDMDGRPAPLLEQATAARIPTYDTTPIRVLRAAPSGAETSILERLRALGYVQ